MSIEASKYRIVHASCTEKFISVSFEISELETLGQLQLKSHEELSEKLLQTERPGV